MTKEVLKYLIQKLKDLFATKEEIPTKTSDLTNDNGYLTSIPSEYVTETELDNKGYLTEHQDISGKADKSYVDTELAKKSDKTHTHSYNDLSDKPTIPSIDGLATKKELTDGLATKSDTTHTHDQYLTEHQDLSNYALKTELPTVPTKVSQLQNDKGYITEIPSEYITETELSAKGYLTEHQDISGKANISDLSTVATSGSYNDLTNKPTIPNKTSQLQNDSGYLTSIPNEYVTDEELNAKGYLTSIPSEYITETELNSKGYLTQHQDISGKVDKVDGKGLSTNDLTNNLKTQYDKAYSHSQSAHAPINAEANVQSDWNVTDVSSDAYILNKPTIPNKTSQLTNDSGYLTSIPSEYITESELNSKGYLTQHQDISGKVDKINGKGLSTNDYTTEEKNKLSGIEENANNYSLPIASSTVLGGIKIGNGLSIDSNGVLSSNGGGSSDLSNYQTKTDNNLTTTNKTIVGAINELDIEGIKAEDYNNDPVVVGNNLVARVSALETNESEVLSRVNSLESNKADVSRVSALETNKADKSSIPTSLPANGGNSNTVGGFSIWVGTQSEYDAITTKSSTTLYFIREV